MCILELIIVEIFTPEIKKKNTPEINKHLLIIIIINIIN